jgi:hypothetical protein
MGFDELPKTDEARGEITRKLGSDAAS